MNSYEVHVVVVDVSLSTGFKRTQFKCGELKL